jgi:hypothetical protein
MQWSFTTNVLAWWGAIVATLVLLWDIRKWHKEGVRLSARIEGIDVPAGEGVRCEICNRGGKATTIREVMLVTLQEEWWLRLLGMSKSIRNLSASAPEINLPFLLVPGAAWSGTYFFPKKESHPVGNENYSELLERGRLYYKVRFSHSNRCVRGRVKKEGLADLWG